MTKTYEEHEADIMRETPYYAATPLDIEDAARRRVLADWLEETKTRLMALASDQDKAEVLWTRFASREFTMWQRLAKFKQLLISHKLATLEECNAVSLDPPKYQDKALFIER